MIKKAAVVQELEQQALLAVFLFWRSNFAAAVLFAAHVFPACAHERLIPQYKADITSRCTAPLQDAFWKVVAGAGFEPAAFRL